MTRFLSIFRQRQKDSQKNRDKSNRERGRERRDPCCLVGMFSGISSIFQFKVSFPLFLFPYLATRSYHHHHFQRSSSERIQPNKVQLKEQNKQTKPAKERVGGWKGHKACPNARHKTKGRKRRKKGWREEKAIQTNQTKQTNEWTMHDHRNTNNWT